MGFARLVVVALLVGACTAVPVTVRDNYHFTGIEEIGVELCTVCAPGQKVVRRCTLFTDTICGPDPDFISFQPTMQFYFASPVMESGIVDIGAKCEKPSQLSLFEAFGKARHVLRFEKGTGFEFDLNALVNSDGKAATRGYTVMADFAMDELDDNVFRRVFNAHAGNNNGLYLHNRKLRMFPREPYGPQALSPNVVYHVVLRANQDGYTVHVNGQPQLDERDGTMWEHLQPRGPASLFNDAGVECDSTEENSAGYVLAMRVYDHWISDRQLAEAARVYANVEAN